LPRLNEIDELKDLYDVARRSVVRARLAKLDAEQLAEVRRRERLMAVIAAEILRLKCETSHRLNPSAS
jgi:hypothetical protein